ncbi:alginate export family protein [Sphingosinicella rhizophila]|uniref:Alginate export family protein n=1 Tax=Sphingosinicella rhizophila TaxID=3050082 RepID=A0ABU3Q914_9SPHN|nr:alginate export family protein [Sphingosinicella sp. GR2756]MDT9599891.1 alginate export family protein [Sphingosinicella sp. GR2756]
MAAAILASATGTAAAAQEAGAPDRVQLKPILDTRLRYESVDQPGLDADALTLRMRAGAEVRLGSFSLLAEGEATLAPIDSYNAFPFPLPSEAQRRPGYAVVADATNAEINRLQLQYRSGASTITLGRQRINLDDQRWVGSVGWRQNEQTFDALRVETIAGPVAVDLTYAVSQRSIFGQDAGPRTAYDGNFLFAGFTSSLGPFRGRLFAYLLDHEEDFFFANSSQSYGAILSTTVPLQANGGITLRGSYARQADYGNNPFEYAADYWTVEGATDLAGFTVTAGWEQLGSDSGRAVQTPMATLHKFNGWADLFLTTPPAGLEDAYVSIGRRFEGVRLLSGLNATLAFHQFDSAAGDVEYGTEWNASIGFRVGPIGILAKLADYQASGFGTDTRRMWLQAEWAF